MKIAFIFVLVFYAVGVYSTISESQLKEKLSTIRNVCAIESGLGPYDIGYVIRAIRPAEKFVNTTQCIMKTLIEQRDHDQDEAVIEILRRIKLIFKDGILPKTIERMISSCKDIIGVESCKRIINFAELIIESVRRNQLVL